MARGTLGARLGRDGSAGRRGRSLAITIALAFVLSLCACMVAGCTSAEDLARTLQTEQDATLRQKAAADLAGRHSLVATQELVTAAAADAIASSGLDSLVNEYAAVLSASVQKAAEAGKEFGEGTVRDLEETVDCLQCIGNAAAVDCLGGFASASSGTIPDVTSLQFRCLGALKALKTDVAILWLGQVAGGLVTGAKALELSAVASVYLEDIGGPALDVLVAALADKEWADDVLVLMGAPAVPRLVEELASSDITARYNALGVLLLMFDWDSMAVAPELVKAERVPLLIEARAEAGYDDARDTIAETVLLEIGQPVVGPLLTVVPRTDWAEGLLVRMGADAVPDVVAALVLQPCAAGVLATIGAAAIPKVVEQLDSADDSVRHRAIGVLLRMYEASVPEVDSQLLTADMVPRLLADLTSKTSFEEYKSFEHGLWAEFALMEIGEPAVAPVLASDYEFKWWVLQGMGASAAPALTATMTGKDREDSLSAAMCLAVIAEWAPEAVASFTAALTNEDLEFIAVNYLYYIALGQAGSEEVISQALLEHGKKQMGLDCLNSGNDILDAAGRKWARNHNYVVYTSDSPVPAISWGGN